MVLNGSPKCERSDTLHMTRAFPEGISSASQNEISYIDAATKRIEYCCGQMSCMRNGGRCVRDDDMAQILRDILASDLLLFSFPLYGFGVPAPLKALLDRTLPLGSQAMQRVGDRYEHVPQADLSHLRYALISGCGFPNARHIFDALRLQFRLRFPGGIFMLTVAGAPLFSAPEAAAVTAPFLQLVQQAGLEYALSGAVSEELMAQLAVPMIPEETYAAICSGGV